MNYWWFGFSRRLLVGTHYDCPSCGVGLGFRHLKNQCSSNDVGTQVRLSSADSLNNLAFPVFAFANFPKLHLRGRRAESLGLGIGAFAYYRRVVENQKGRILSEIGRVAKRLGASPEKIKLFEEAEKETQFTKAIDIVKSAIPDSLLISGQNPLTLLYSPLSEGIHELTDEKCLELATSIRVVLTELAERTSRALQDQKELDDAVSRLLNREAKPTTAYREGKPAPEKK